VREVLTALAGTERHPHARAVLQAAVGPEGSPSHAYLFHGPAGAGKREVARALTAALLTEGVADPAGARLRVEHGTHPDLTWVTPSGAHEMLVGDIDEPVVAAATRTPFEAERRVFVLERADTLIETAANKLLKTLEEPAPHVHLILLTDRLGDVLPTIVSRCQLVRFDPLPPNALAERLERHGVAPDAARACARLALGNGDEALALALGDGPALRAAAEGFARAALAGSGGAAKSWEALLAEAARRGDAVRAEVAARAAEAQELAPAREKRKIENEWNQRATRAKRRAETAWLTLGLRLAGLWFRDLVAVRVGAPELVHHLDRADALADDAQRADPVALRRSVELVEETRERLALNVTEPLALEALAYRLETTLA
jgi:DNA polymerase III subunit delta'